MRRLQDQLAESNREKEELAQQLLRERVAKLDVMEELASKDVQIRSLCETKDLSRQLHESSIACDRANDFIRILAANSDRLKDSEAKVLSLKNRLRKKQLALETVSRRLADAEQRLGTTTKASSTPAKRLPLSDAGKVKVQAPSPIPIPSPTRPALRTPRSLLGAVNTTQPINKDTYPYLFNNLILLVYD